MVRSASQTIFIFSVAILCLLTPFSAIAQSSVVNVIKNEVEDIGSSSATILYETDKEARAQILYGTSPSSLYMKGRYSSRFLSGERSETLLNLEPSTTYYYTISIRPKRRGARVFNTAVKQFTTLNVSVSTTLPPTTTTLPSTTTTTSSTTTTTTTTIATSLSPRDILLADRNRVGYGAGATGGTNIVEVTTETEFFNALKVDGNYVLISPSLANTTIVRNTTFEIYANNITIDGSLAPGFKFKVGPGMPSNSWLFRVFGDNVIIHNIEGEGIDFYPPRKNQSFLNIYGENIWIDKVTATGFDDDYINILLDSDFITVSRIKSYDTNKSVMVFNPNPGQGDTRITVHSSWMASNQRPPLISSGYAHTFNNYVEVASLEVGRNSTQAVSINHRDPAYCISENNVYDNQLYQGMIATAKNINNEGFIESVGDNLNGNVTVGNVTFSSNPTLFTIPYSYSSVLKPTADVVGFVKANAGADR